VGLRITNRPPGRQARAGCYRANSGVGLISSLASLLGCGTVRRIRTAPAQTADNWPKRTPPGSTVLPAIDSGNTDEELPDMVGRLTQLSQAPCEKTSPFSPAGRDHDE